MSEGNFHQPDEIRRLGFTLLDDGVLLDRGG